MEPFNGIKMDDGGDVSAALQQLVSPFKPLAAPAQMAQGLAANPSVQNAVGGIMNSMTPGASPMPQGATPTAATQPQMDPAFMQQLQQGTTGMPSPAQGPAPTPNPIMQTAQAAQNIPPTNPGIYNGISAEDRAALMQKLIAQKSSPGMLAASGAAGLGDAITSAFGKSPTNAQGNLRQAENQNIEQRAGIIDTERQQKMQDVAANMMVMKSDPNSSMSKMARQMYNQMNPGKTAPSGITAAQLETLNPLIEKTIETSAQQAIAKGEQGVKAATAQYGEGFGQMLKDLLGFQGTETGEAGLQAAQKEAFPGTTAPGAGNSMAGWSVKR